MERTSVRLDHWPSVIAHISSVLDLEASARAHRALVRKRGVRCAADLLHLALLYGPGGLSLRAVAGHAAAAGIADLCDVSLLGRLRNSGDFLADILDQLLAGKSGVQNAASGRLRLSLVDGSTVSVPGSAGSDWRLHARHEPALGRFTDLRLSTAAVAESLSCVAVAPGDVLVQDRGYARVCNFVDARSRGADFVTRIGWRSVKLRDGAGQVFDLIAAFPQSGAAVVEYPVFIGHGESAVPARLIMARKPPEARQGQHRRRRRGNANIVGCTALPAARARRPIHARCKRPGS